MTKTDLRYTFAADMQTNQIRMVREFAAPRSTVWACYSRPELLDRWFAPEPLTAKTAHMDFREGGHWHFSMTMPEGDTYWSRFDYQTITPESRIITLDGFSDPEGGVNPDMPRSTVDMQFEDGEVTTVTTVTQYASAEDLQAVIDMGMEAGIGSTLDRLDALLADLTSK